ncbi:MAG: hypothetical protein R3C12_04045 [Planctomycetaceae bacterium]
MTPRKTDHERLKELLIELVDGQPSEEQLDELQQVAKLVRMESSEWLIICWTRCWVTIWDRSRSRH